MMQDEKTAAGGISWGMRSHRVVTYGASGATQTYYGCVIWDKLLNVGVLRLPHL